jgi:hypothetical protein
MEGSSEMVEQVFETINVVILEIIYCLNFSAVCLENAYLFIKANFFNKLPSFEL